MSHSVLTAANFRDAHTGNGPLRVCSAKNFILSGGADESLSMHTSKRWPGSAALWSVKCHQGPITCLDMNIDADMAVSGGRDGHVFLHRGITTGGDALSHQLVCRVTGEINSVLLTADARAVYVAGDSLRCIKLNADFKPEKVVSMSLNVKNPIVALSLSPDESLIAAASASGSIGMQSADGTMERKYVLKDVLPTTRKTDERTALAFDWCTTGRGDVMFAVPCHKCVRLFRYRPDEKETNQQLRLIGVLSVEECGDVFNVAIGPLAKHRLLLVATGVVGRVESFKLDLTKSDLGPQLLGTYGMPEMPSAVSLDRFTGGIAMSFDSGKLGWRKAVTTAFRKRSAGEDETATQQQQEASQATQKYSKRSTADDYNEDEDEEFDAEAAEAATKEEPMRDVAEEDLEEVVTDLIRTNPEYVAQDGIRRKRIEQDVRKGKTGGAISKKKSFLDDEASSASEEEDEGEDEEDYYDDDDGCEAPNPRTGGQSSRANDDSVPADVDAGDGDCDSVEPDEDRQMRIHGLVKPAYEHPLLQMGETSPNDDGYRYAAFNAVGAIRAGPEGMQIQFHDIGRPQIRMNERRKCSMAALGPNFAAMVLEPSEQMLTEAPSLGVTLYCRLFNSIGAQNDWSLQMPQEETPVLIACGMRYVAVVTSRGYLRVWSMSGLEMGIVSLPRRAIAITGVGCDNCKAVTNSMDPLAVVYSQGEELTLELFNCTEDSEPMGAPCGIPLTPKVLQRNQDPPTLAWIGWAPEGRIYAADSEGVVRSLSRSFGAPMWTPVYDPIHVMDTSRLWMVGLGADETIQAYRCGASEMEPPCSGSLPPLDRLRFLLPLLRSGHDKQLLNRSTHLHSALLLREKKHEATAYTDEIAKADMKHDARLFEIFETAMKNQKHARAVDVASHFQLRSTLEKAAAMANEVGVQLVTSRIVAFLQMMIQSKSKRRSKLPAVGSEVSEKDRDRMLRRLLAQQQQQQQQQQGAGAAASPKQQQQVVKQEQAPIRILDEAPPAAPVSATTPDRQEIDKASIATASSSKRVSFAADNATTSEVKRPAAAPLPTVTPLAATTTTNASPAAAKQFNPFAKPAAPAPAAAAPPAKAPAVASPSRVEAKPPAETGSGKKRGRPAKSEAGASPSLTPSRAGAAEPTNAATPSGDSLVKKQPRKEQTTLQFNQPSKQVTDEPEMPPPQFVDVPIDPFLKPGQDGMATLDGFSQFEMAEAATKAKEGSVKAGSASPAKMPSSVIAALEKRDEGLEDDDEDAMPAINISA